MQFKTTPFKHQLEEWEASRSMPLRAVFWEQGTGKTKLIIDTAAWLYEQKEIDALLILAPNGVNDNWVLDELPTHMGLPYRAHAWRSGSAATKWHAVDVAKLTSCDGSLAVLAMSYDGFMTKRGHEAALKFLDKKRCLFVCDECFPAGTLVDTPNGGRRIETIREGDKILNCLGTAVVRATRNRRVDLAVCVDFVGHQITCSEHHPFLTTRGWVFAGELKEGDCCVAREEAVRLVRRGDRGRERLQDALLRDVLLREMEDETTVREGGNLYWRDCPENISGAEEDRHVVDAAATQTTIRETSHGHISSAKGEAVFGDTGRERARLDCPSKKDARVTRRGMGRGGAGLDGNDLLRARYRELRGQDRRGNRRDNPSLQGAQGERPEEGYAARFVRVEGTSRVELGGVGREGRGDTFFDLEVTGHPSYSVHGLLVHNSQRIKTPSAKRTRAAVYAGRRAKYKRVLTGTPVTNSPFDVYCQLKFLDENFWKPTFASYESFKTYFGVWEDRVNSQTGGRFSQIVSYRNIDQLAAIVDRVSSRVTKDQVLDLPPKVYKKVYFEMGPEQARVYEAIKSDMVAFLNSGEVITTPLVIVQLMRLQQVTCGYVPSDGAETLTRFDDNPRLKCLLEVLEDSPGQAIVFARFREDVSQIMDALHCQAMRHGLRDWSAVRYDGVVGQDDRVEARRRFQDGSARYFVGNPAAAGVGLTLTAAKTVVYFSNSFNLEDRLQSEDRAHRIGQSSSVTYVDVVARGTVDSRIVKALRDKLNIASQITGDEVRKWL